MSIKPSSEFSADLNISIDEKTFSSLSHKHRQY